MGRGAWYNYFNLLIFEGGWKGLVALERLCKLDIFFIAVMYHIQTSVFKLQIERMNVARLR